MLTYRPSEWPGGLRCDTVPATVLPRRSRERTVRGPERRWGFADRGCGLCAVRIGGELVMIDREQAIEAVVPLVVFQSTSPDADQRLRFAARVLARRIVDAVVALESKDGLVVEIRRAERERDEAQAAAREMAKALSILESAFADDSLDIPDVNRAAEETIHDVLAKYSGYLGDK